MRASTQPQMTEQQIFEAAAALPAAERAAYLDAACRGRPGMREAVNHLLASLEADAFMQTAVSRPPMDAEAKVNRMKPENVGERIGPYKLLEQIGEGGFGTVWVAEQEQPIRRRVALKIIKLGMDTKEVIARFEQERQALAMMDHPNIARVLDAGTTSFGRPYFVMELVHGIKITTYCDQANLPTADRLRLFITVCHAVQHAHQKGIIHRDLKPSNILVTLHDGVPVPKVIDFGVAKATQQQRLTDLTVYTQFEQMIGTPLYMSPEQAEMSGLDIDTRSDIYSLGVLLYELLVGHTPFDPEKLMKSGFDEMRRVIREQEPQKPSTFVGTMSLELRTNLAKHRQTDSANLVGQISGDLDWIVMKALEKDRTRRYETANGLSHDIQRHLLSEPVLARPPTAIYRFRRFVRRNRGAFAAGTAITAVLITGTAISIWQAVRARSALSELRGSAPAFAEQARNLAAKEKFDEAISKLDTSIKLRPDVVEYKIAKAHLLRSQFRFSEAGLLYLEAAKLGNSDRGRENYELCQNFAAESAQKELSRQSLIQLLEVMKFEKRPPAEMLRVGRRLGEENQLLLAYWLDRLQEFPIGPSKPLTERLELDDSGRLRLDLSGTDVSDLSPIAGMPLDQLVLSGCEQITDLGPLRGMPLRDLALGPLDSIRLRRACTVSDLSPLQGMPLEKLNLAGTRVFELSPLRGMKLTDLILSNTIVTDLSPLSGMPLTSLDCTALPVADFSVLQTTPLSHLLLNQTSVVDLSFLRVLPLKSISLEGCVRARNYSVLSELLGLESLILPAEYPDLPEVELHSIDSLRRHPNLHYVSRGASKVSALQSLNVDQSPRVDFWGEFDKEQQYQSILMRVCGERGRFRRRGAAWVVNLEGLPIDDISLLAGVPISSLLLSGTRVSDLTPVRGMPLQVLYAANTQIESLEPLRNLPLVRVYLDNCPLGLDLEPLSGIKTLYSVLLPPQPRRLETLRGLPNLKFISYEVDKGYDNRFEQTAEEFWGGQAPKTAEALAREGRFAEAEDILRLKVKSSRAVEHWESLAAVLLAQRAYDRYTAFAEEMLQEYRGEDLEDLATVRVCLFTPKLLIPVAKIKPLMQSLGASEPNTYNGGWFLCVRAMFELRAGNSTGALKILARIKSNQYGSESATSATAAVIRGMTLLELGKPEAANQSMEAARALIASRWPAPERRLSYWHEWLIAYVLLAEAERQRGVR